jgi:transposase
MIKTIVHHERVTALAVTDTQNKTSPVAIKLGVDVHQASYVVAVQEGHSTPKPARRFELAEFVPWVERWLARGHAVFVVYEACGFGFGLQRQLSALGATCYVIAPRKLDEQRTGVKTDRRDAAALCQRLSRYLEGNKKELAVIRVPTEEEEQLRDIHRQREALVRARTKLQAQGRALLVTYGLPAPARWWRRAGWIALEKLLPPGLRTRLQVFRPVLAVLDAQIAALSVELEKAAPASLPAGLGKLTSVVVSREVCDWQRFHNRRQVASYTGLCPGEYSSGGKRVLGSVTKHGNPRLRAALVELAWRMVRFQPDFSTHPQTDQPPRPRRAGHRCAAQESHRRCRAAAGRRSLAAPDRPSHGGSTPTALLNS